MPDYKESQVTGTKWQRASRVVIENPRGGTPSILFVEEEVVNLGDSEIIRPVANCSATFDPNNAEHTALYAMLDALYTQIRTERDGQNDE